MPPTLLPSLFALLNGGELIALVCVVGGLGFVLVCAVSAMYFRHRQSVLWHETARIALEKGQPIPPPPVGLDDHGDRSGFTASLPPEQRIALQRAQRIRGYLIGGLINIAVGVGAFIALVNLQPRIPMNVQYFALIPVCIGIALLLGVAIEALVGRKLDQPSAQR